MKDLVIAALQWAVARGKEASSYGGLTGLFVEFHINPALQPSIVSILVGLCGVLAILVPEKKKS